MAAYFDLEVGSSSFGVDQGEGIPYQREEDGASVHCN